MACLWYTDTSQASLCARCQAYKKSCREGAPGKGVLLPKKRRVVVVDNDDDDIIMDDGNVDDDGDMGDLFPRYWNRARGLPSPPPPPLIVVTVVVFDPRVRDGRMETAGESE